MAKAGFKNVDANPDVIVATHAVTKEEKELSASGYRGGLRWGGGMGTASVMTYTYAVGSLVMDLYDAKTKQLVWRGTATDSLEDKPEKNAVKIVKALDKMFKAYPPKLKKRRDDAGPNYGLRLQVLIELGKRATSADVTLRSSSRVCLER